ncbi:hypothetical protein [Cobetia crustatorum]|uniref:Uncharacterized protein n=1 Tax=Cobetia crustatorum TaxID=553385 RepID=A0A558HDK6_9GAMM|nr:hypothetical protein [Cobetia crustatorum]TVU67216.1 hypothetical protein FQP86_17390 [Cobetia crustatorum]
MYSSKPEGRSYSKIADGAACMALQALLSAGESKDTHAYQYQMERLGFLLGKSMRDGKSLASAKTVLVVSTAEDADYLASGVIKALKKKYSVKFAVFWNNHYSLENKSSIAPVINTYYEPGYEKSDALVIVKSVISGSCVVKTNLMRLMSVEESLLKNSVHVVAPVIHESAEQKLKSEFPCSISEKFTFVYFAKDKIRSSDGDVIPGIGGQIYELLGLKGQPARTGYIPALVKQQYSAEAI